MNEQETMQFYTEKPGFTFHASRDGCLIFSRDDISIHLWPCNNPVIPQNTGCYTNVTDVKSLYKEYQPTGVVHLNGLLEDKP